MSTAAPAPMAMFPLGTVLAPGLSLPLHVFEPRYRALMADCLDGDGVFGVVLIERGSEVGGGDQRCDVGTTASIEQYRRGDDGRYAVLARGRDRFRVHRWFDDDPYPGASIVPWPDVPLDVADRPLLAEARERLASLGGGDAPDLAEDPSVASHQLVGVAPLGPYDRYRLLCEPGPAARLRSLIDLLAPSA